MGVALQGKRHQAVLATKFAMQMGSSDKQGGSRRYIMDAVEASLRRLKTDYIDLYQIHRFDADTLIEETLGALDDLVTQGKVATSGIPEPSGWQIADADWISGTPTRTASSRRRTTTACSKRRVEHEVNPACERLRPRHAAVLPASGLLTGKYKRGEAPPEGHPARSLGPARGAGAERPELRPAGQAAEFGPKRVATTCSTSRSPGCSATRWCRQ